MGQEGPTRGHDEVSLWRLVPFPAGEFACEKVTSLVSFREGHPEVERKSHGGPSLFHNPLTFGNPIRGVRGAGPHARALTFGHVFSQLTLTWKPRLANTNT